MNNSSFSPPSTRPGFTMMELLVAIAIVVSLAAIAFTVMGTVREKAELARAMEKINSIGDAFVGYTADNNGLLPYEDAPGTDDWNTAAMPEASEAWYNALPIAMGSPSVGDLSQDPERFYDESYPLYVPGAPYPKGDSKYRSPLFAIGMNSRLQRKGEDEYKEQGTLASILDPSRTVAFLERGLPGEKKVSTHQRGFNGTPKCNARALAARHNQKGILLFVDGHTEEVRVEEILDSGGQIPYPQTKYIWTRDPDEDPN